MYSIAWPVTGLFFCTLAAVLGEMASAYPVAGESFALQVLSAERRLMESRRDRCHVHLGLPPVSEFETVGSMGSILVVGDGIVPSLLPYLGPSQSRRLFLPAVTDRVSRRL